MAEQKRTRVSSKLMALATGAAVVFVTGAAVFPAALASAKPLSQKSKTKLQNLETAVGKESKATFKITYAFKNNASKGSYVVEQRPPAQLLRTSPPSPDEMIYNGKKTYDCSLSGNPITCIVYPSASASPVRALMASFLDVSSYVSIMKGWQAVIGAKSAGFKVSFSTATFAGQPSECVKWSFGIQKARYCVTDKGILAYVGGSSGHGTSNAFWLTHYSSHASSSDFSLPKGAKIAKLP